MHALAEIRRGLLRLQWLLAARRRVRALHWYGLALKAGYNPDQPRLMARIFSGRILHPRCIQPVITERLLHCEIG